MRAFLWERLAMKQAGVPLAEAALFNGIKGDAGAMIRTVYAALQAHRVARVPLAEEVAA